jgi:hypothetical protein
MCHTLKYLILGCDYLLQYVHLLIGFSENFKDFSGNYFIYPRAKSIFLLESSKKGNLSLEFQVFYLDSSYPKLTPEFSSENSGILSDIFFLV